VSVHTDGGFRCALLRYFCGFATAADPEWDQEGSGGSGGFGGDPGTWRGGGREGFGGIRGAGRPGTEASGEGKGKPGREEAWEEASAGIGRHPGTGWESHREASGDRRGVPEWSISQGYPSSYELFHY
jgi:hypothetical protein